jgi:hypothetical protein
MAEARPNIAIAPIRIDARIIVSLYLGGCSPLSGRCSDDKRPNALSPTAIGVTTSTITFSRLLEPFTGAWPVWDHELRSQVRAGGRQVRCF